MSVSMYTDDWKRTVDIAKEAGEYGDALNLSCFRHKNKAIVKDPKDFKKYSTRGIHVQPFKFFTT